MVAGKLDGGPQVDLAWAENPNVACFPSPQNKHFDGAHKFYAIDLPAMSDLTITVTPADPKLDISLYGYMVAANNTTALPPNVSHATSCEESHGTRSLSAPYNPGKPEKISLDSTTNAYRVYVGVAGARGTKVGAFKLQVALKTAAPPPSGKVGAATKIPISPNSAAEVAGKLDGGPQIDLAWAANPNVACFTAPQSEHFAGAHKVYAIDMPPESELTITATPGDPELDISLYGYTVNASNTTSLPPNVPSVVSCEESHGTRSMSAPYNPGKPEKITLGTGDNPYRAYIGVTAVRGTLTGAFKLKAVLKTTVHKTGKVKAATKIAVQPNTTTKVAGKLDGGPQIDLGWASDNACFTGPQSEHFDGAHKVYAIDLPANSELTVTATPNNSKLDISMYGYTVSANDTTTLPPNIPSVVSCEASCGSQLMSAPYNPGKPEKIVLETYDNPYRAYVGIAGATGTTTGGFTLQAALKRK